MVLVENVAYLGEREELEKYLNRRAQYSESIFSSCQIKNFAVLCTVKGRENRLKMYSRVTRGMLREGSKDMYTPAPCTPASDNWEAVGRRQW